MPVDYQIDKLDRQILQLLLGNAQLPYSEIAQKLTISNGTVHVRMNKLMASGIVRGSTLDIDVSKLGLDICAFIGVFLDEGSYYKEVLDKMKQIPEIVEVHYTTGIYSMFIKIVCKDTQKLRELLGEKIQAISGIQRTETFISLEEGFRRAVSLE